MDKLVPHPTVTRFIRATSCRSSFEFTLFEPEIISEREVLRRLWGESTAPNEQNANALAPFRAAAEIGTGTDTATNAFVFSNPPSASPAATPPEKFSFK